MEVRVVSGALTEIDTPLLVLGTFEDDPLAGPVATLDQAADGLIGGLVADGELTGEATQVAVVHLPASARAQARRVAVVGLGRAQEVDLEAVRVGAALAARKARDLKLDRLALSIPEVPGLAPREVSRVAVEAAILALYRYEQFKETTKATHQVQGLDVVAADAAQAAELQPVVDVAVATCAAMHRVRDLSVGPSNYVTPQYLADQARAVAEANGLEILVWGKDELRAHGMHGILAVNQGSALPPAFVALRYRAPAGDAAKTLAVVGKGITFDTGGISLKPAEHMENMRHDMTGAATVIGFLELAARTTLPVNVLGVFAATENMPGGSAYKPGDVIRASNGRTMEIVNTDAEGRVILSDCLVYASREKPDAIVDLATLTGAIGVALGDHATGLFTNHQALADRLLALGEVSGDRCWQLPMWRVYRAQIKTAMADVKNSGGRKAGAITAAQFLEEFVDDVPWVHLDIASTAYADSSQTYVAPYNPKPGATGVGVRLLWHFCQTWATDS